MEASKAIPQRLYSKDIQALLAPLTPSVRIPLRLPKVIFDTFVQIENILKEFHSHPDDLSINQVETLGLSQDLINELTAKMFELVDMFENADNDSYPNHVSMGSVNNVGMTVLRRCFYVAIQHNTPPNIPKINQRANPYPYVEVHSQLLQYLSSLFLRIYKYHLQKELFPLYVAGCLQLCCYTTFVGFNVKSPQDVYWQTIYDYVFDLIKGSNIKPPRDSRYWHKQ